MMMMMMMMMKRTIYVCLFIVSAEAVFAQQSDPMQDLQQDVGALGVSQRHVFEDVQKLQAEIMSLRQEIAKLKAPPEAERKPGAPVSGPSVTPPTPTTKE